jgi:hypothetical protein
MKQLFTRMGLMLLAAFVLTAFATGTVQAGEKKKISGTKTTKRIVSRTNSFPADDPKHVLSQTVREDLIAGSDPDWNDTEAVAYEQSDYVAGNGSHKGYLIVRHKSGDESHLKYQGSDKISAQDNGSWEVVSEGEIQIVGGTGKFKDMRGSGTYKGKSTPKGSQVTWEVTIEN